MPTLPRPALRALALALTFSAPAFAQSYSFTNLAGLPTQVGAADGTGAAASFANPETIAVDAAGNVYVADTGNFLIRKITPAGVVTTLAGSPGIEGSADGTGAAARFSLVYALAVDRAGNVLVSDYGNHAIRRITPAGVVTTLAGLSGSSGSADGNGAAARFFNPLGLAVDASDNVFVADRGNRTIRKIAPDGMVTTIAGQAGAPIGVVDGVGGAARFAGMGGLALDGAGNLFLVDNTNHVIRKIAPDAAVTTFAGGVGASGTTNGSGTAARFDRPTGIATDAAGNVYVADTFNDTIRRITPDGVVSLFAGAADLAGASNGAAPRFFRPRGVAVDAAGTVYVADTYNQAIRKVTPAGVASTLAGFGGNFGSADGQGSAARFSRPRGIAVDSRGNLYVSDNLNSTIRQITPGGFVSTLSGAPGEFRYNDASASESRFGTPFGVAVDRDDNVYVADSFFNAIRRISSIGVRTWSGVAGTTGGSNDGHATVARYRFPIGVALDAQGNTYVTDTLNHTIRKMTPAGDVTTLAGSAGNAGAADGTGAAARFTEPTGIAVDAAGTIYVSDNGNSTIRRITPAGIVTTLAGSAGLTGSADGTGAAARFSSPEGLAVDEAGNVFVADFNNDSIRRITPTGVVTTIAGTAGRWGGEAGTGRAARFFAPSAIAIDRAGVLYVANAFGNTIARGALDQPPVIVAPPLAPIVQPGGTATFTVGATGGGLTYEWMFNGVAIPGANSPTLVLRNVQPANVGTYNVWVTNSAGATISGSVSLGLITTTDVGRITNLAIRSHVGTGAEALFVGFVLGGAGTSGTKPMLVRAVGPTLGGFGVPGVLADPKLELFTGIAKTHENDNWAGDAAVTAASAQVGAFAFASAGSRDAALFGSGFGSANYNVQVSGVGTDTGVALAEIYDATPRASYTAATPRLLNVAARTRVGTGGEILIAGFVIGGQTSKTVLIRAVGPTLATFGVGGALIDPRLELIRLGPTGGPTKINENDNWAGDPALAAAFNAVGAFPLPAGSSDAALLVSLPPGSYTAQVSGVGGLTGVALVEVYDVP